MILLLLLILALLFLIPYFFYIFRRFHHPRMLANKKLRRKRWFFLDETLESYGINVTVRFYLKKFVVYFIKKTKSKNRHLKFYSYKRLRWKKKPRITATVFFSRSSKKVILVVSFR